MSNLRDQIAAYDDKQFETVEVPEWGGVKLLVVGMTGEARSEFYERVADPETNEVDVKLFHPEVLVSTCYDPDDPETPVFTSGDAAMLMKKSGAALQRVAQVGLRLSGMGPEEEKLMGNVSSPGPDDSSST